MAKRTKRSRYTHTYKGAQAYENTHVDPRALDYVYDIVERLRKGKGFVGKQYVWFNDAYPSDKYVATPFPKVIYLTTTTITEFHSCIIRRKQPETSRPSGKRWKRGTYCSLP